MNYSQSLVAGLALGLLLGCMRERPPRAPFPGELAEALGEEAATRNLVERPDALPSWLQRSGVPFECERVSCGAQPCETRCRSTTPKQRDVKRTVRAIRREFGREQLRSENDSGQTWQWTWRREGAVARERHGVISLESRAGDSADGKVLELRIQLGPVSLGQHSTCPCER